MKKIIPADQVPEGISAELDIPILVIVNDDSEQRETAWIAEIPFRKVWCESGYHLFKYVTDDNLQGDDSSSDDLLEIVNLADRTYAVLRLFDNTESYELHIEEIQKNCDWILVYYLALTKTSSGDYCVCGASDAEWCYQQYAAQMKLFDGSK